MIFLSHNFKDKPIVEPIAIKLKEIFGQSEIFYDSWSIQPGEGIIDKMNAGLESCNLFLFFVSKNSLQSNMVKLEWQNAIIKATKSETKIIPVKLDDCFMPSILLQNLYIDLYGQGLEIALRQIIDITNGKNTFQQNNQSFSNLRAYKYFENEKLIIECRALYYMEPISQFLFLIGNKQTELTFTCKSSSIFNSGFNQNIKLNNGIVSDGFAMGVGSATTPGFPFIAEITPIDNNIIIFRGVLHAVKSNLWTMIPLVEGKPDKL